MSRTQFPQWLKKRLVSNENVFEMKRLLSALQVNTVCESGLCPNLNECFSKKFAAFLILGSVCTRACAFCSTRKGSPEAVDKDEPYRILDIVKRLGLKYAVITSVTRDDIENGGAGQFAKTVALIKKFSKDIKVEVLIPDFKGHAEPLASILREGPDVVAHNIETVPRLYPEVRQGSDYNRSLAVLKTAKEIAPRIAVKSSVMLGLGETKDEVVATLEDLRGAGCDILTLGQYLRPQPGNIAVKRFIEPQEFDYYRMIGKEMGFSYVSAGAFVRSSYFADMVYEKSMERDHDRCYVAAVS